MLPGVAVHAEDAWVTVLSSSDRVIEVDRGSIIRSDSGTKVAWARMRLPETEAFAAGFTTVHALNRYDCTNRNFQTIRRRYLDGRNLIVKEESVPPGRPIAVTRSEVDDALWREVCRPAAIQSGDEVARLARDADRIASVLSGRSQAAERGGPAAPPASAAPTVTAPAPTSPVSPAPPETTPPPAPSPAPASPPPRVTPAVAALPLPLAEPHDDAGGWEYAGSRGPEHWGQLRPDWAQCAEGRRQSPIHVRDALEVGLEAVEFDYRPSLFRTTDTGRQLEVRVGEGQGAHIRGERYELITIRLHRPGQEHINGRSFDLSIDLIHRAANGRLAVVTVMADVGDKAQPVLQTWLDHVPLEHGGNYTPDAVVDVSGLLPADPGHYLYMGSLSTPPCTEGVVQVVMREPISLSWEQFRILSRLHPPSSRPLQPEHARRVFVSR